MSNPSPALDSPAAMGQPIDGPAAPRKRVLLADDSPQIRESLGKLLRRAGYHVMFAAHGGQVLELAFHETIDLLLLDLNMPHMDGWEALEQVASFKPTLPVIIITAQPHQSNWVFASGAHALLEKPLDLPLLLQTIEELLREPPGSRTDGTRGRRERFRHHSAWKQSVWPPQPAPQGGIND
jgi:CheY-like chemotaxis protein